MIDSRASNVSEAALVITRNPEVLIIVSMILYIN